MRRSHRLASLGSFILVTVSAPVLCVRYFCTIDGKDFVFIAGCMDGTCHVLKLSHSEAAGGAGRQSEVLLRWRDHDSYVLT